jgi:hypothetical protein
MPVAPVDPKRDIEPKYQRLCAKVNDLNRNVFQVYMDHFAPFEVDKNPSDDQTSARKNPKLVPSRGPGLSLGSEAIRQATDHNSKPMPSDAAQGKREYHTECWPSTGDRRGNPKSTYDKHGNRRQQPDPKRADNETEPIASAIVDGASDCPTLTHAPPTNAAPSRRHSTRPQNNKRFRYEPEAMGQGPREASGMSATQHQRPWSKQIIVDTGASHILFREQDSSLLTNVQMSPPIARPFAILTAANGASLKSIGRGMLNLATITVVAYIFRDSELVHNLLGIAPFADLDCTATFSATQFQLHHLSKVPILLGERHARNLWRIHIPDAAKSAHTLPTYEPNQVLLLHHTSPADAEHVRFVHACLGSPPPTTFLRAVARGYINGPRQFPRLTTKMVRRNMPSSEATARGHLRKMPTGQPHSESDVVSALRRHHHASVIQALFKTHHKQLKFKSPIPAFDPTSVHKSTKLHFDYTGPLPERCASGMLYFMVSCWGFYINIQPLTSLKGTQTAEALVKTVQFYRSHGIILDDIRMDNQTSPELRAVAVKLGLTKGPVPSNQKEPNRVSSRLPTHALGQNDLPDRIDP